MTELQIEPHPLLECFAFAAAFPDAVGQIPSPAWLVELLRADAPSPVTRSEEVRAAVRDLLRYGGYKPTGRGKPASEYLARAACEGALHSINVAVDACNVVSLHSGVPISVVDLDLVRPPLRIAIAGSGASYAFNATGQIIDAEGLVCLHDIEGPCANAVKDAQRTKTSESTQRTLAIHWGAHAYSREAAASAAWHRELLGRAGAIITDVSIA